MALLVVALVILAIGLFFTARLAYRFARRTAFLEARVEQLERQIDAAGLGEQVIDLERRVTLLEHGGHRRN